MGVKIGPEGKIWYVDYDANKVFKIDGDGLEWIEPEPVPSDLSSIEEASVKLFPNPTQRDFKIEFGNALYHPHEGHMAGVLSSSGFEYKDDDNAVFTGYLEDDGYGKIQMWKVGINGEKVLVYFGVYPS